MLALKHTQIFTICFTFRSKDQTAYLHIDPNYYHQRLLCRSTLAITPSPKPLREGHQTTPWFHYERQGQRTGGVRGIGLGGPQGRGRHMGSFDFDFSLLIFLPPPSGRSPTLRPVDSFTLFRSREWAIATFLNYVIKKIKVLQVRGADGDSHLPGQRPGGLAAADGPGPGPGRGNAVRGPTAAGRGPAAPAPGARLPGQQLLLPVHRLRQYGVAVAADGG